MVNEYVLGSFQRSPESIVNDFKAHRGGLRPTWNNETYCSHAADLIQSQPQEFLIAALGHQFEGRLLQVGRTLKHQASYAANTLTRDEGVQDKCRDGDRGEEE